MTATTHNPFDEIHWASCLRENLTSSSYGEGLETGRGVTAEAPRQSFTRQTWHKVLKSGCKVEDCLLETGTRLKRYLALFSIIAVRLMYITCVARACPEAPATEVFSGDEIEALHLRLKKVPPPPERPPSLRAMVRMIGGLGGLGGHLGRKCDGEPGIIVLWRGLTRLYEDIEMLLACKQLGRINSS